MQTRERARSGRTALTCAHCNDVPDLFGPKVARHDLRRYRRRGPPGATRHLLHGLLAEGVEGGTLLDIGGGVGVLQHELLAAGAARAIGVEASPAYQEVAREEAARRGHADRIEFHFGDFVDMAAALPEADVVTLDRVICCYPDMEALVSRSASRARRLWGAVLPRERLAVRLAVRLGNLIQRLRGSAFRGYVHPVSGVEDVLRARGFTRRHHARTLLWEVMVWRREG